MNFRFITIASLSLSPAAMSAQTEMTVNSVYADTEAWGTARTERYDVAFHLDDSSLMGKKITEVKIPFSDNSGISDCAIWLSRELTLESSQNTPDIIQISSTPEDGYLSASFSSAIEIEEEGCYVGFSFTVNELNDESKQPVTVSPAAEPGNMYVHTSRRYLKWGTQNLSLTPSMEITLSGDFHGNAVAVISLPETGSLKDTPAAITAILRNHGLKDVSSIDYQITTDKSTETRHIDYDTPLPTHYFADVCLPIDLCSDLQAGSYPLSLEITKVNGEDNLAAEYAAESCLYIYPYLPERIPLMEEYTGTWCGWCPRGIVGMERMSGLYPDKFIYAAYHRDKDPMNTVETLATPYEGAPSGYLDRVVAVDPYNGTSQTTVASAKEGIGKAWDERRGAITTGEISAEASWKDEAHEIIEVKSRSLFVRDYASTRFKIGYLLIADGLKGEGNDWTQSNYFSDEQQYANTELVEFVNQPSHISDMSFDGVVVMTSDLTGVDGSLPDAIKMEQPEYYSYSFDVREAVSYMGVALPLDKERLHVIAYIADNTTGGIVNCTKCDITDPASVNGITTDDASVNVVNGRIVISCINGDADVSLLSLSGMTICQTRGNGEISLPVSANGGVYILKINGRSRKLMVE